MSLATRLASAVLKQELVGNGERQENTYSTMRNSVTVPVIVNSLDLISSLVVFLVCYSYKASMGQRIMNKTRNSLKLVDLSLSEGD
jgi:hypothetical protein